MVHSRGEDCVKLGLTERSRVASEWPGCRCMRTGEHHESDDGKPEAAFVALDAKLGEEGRQGGIVAKHNIFRLIAAVGALVVLTLAGPTAAFAQPSNDDFATATAINSLPFSTSEDTSQ